MALGPLLDEIRAAWTQALGHPGSWSDSREGYQVTNGWAVSVYRVEPLDEGLIHVPDGGGGKGEISSWCVEGGAL